MSGLVAGWTEDKLMVVLLSTEPVGLARLAEGIGNVFTEVVEDFVGLTDLLIIGLAVEVGCDDTTLVAAILVEGR